MVEPLGRPGFLYRYSNVHSSSRRSQFWHGPREVGVEGPASEVVVVGKMHRTYSPSRQTWTNHVQTRVGGGREQTFRARQ